MHDTPTALAIIAGAFLVAGTVKGVIGMGLPTVAMGVLGLVMPPVQAAALLVVPSLATNVWQMLAGPAFGAAVKRFATMLIGVSAPPISPHRATSGRIKLGSIKIMPALIKKLKYQRFVMYMIIISDLLVR